MLKFDTKYLPVHLPDMDTIRACRARHFIEKIKEVSEYMDEAALLLEDIGETFSNLPDSDPYSEDIEIFQPGYRQFEKDYYNNYHAHLLSCAFYVRHHDELHRIAKTDRVGRPPAVSDDDVEGMIDAYFVANGRPPSVRVLRDIAGGGSMTRLSRLISEYSEGLSSSPH